MEPQKSVIVISNLKDFIGVPVTLLFSNLVLTPVSCIVCLSLLMPDLWSTVCNNNAFIVLIWRSTYKPLKLLGIIYYKGLFTNTCWGAWCLKKNCKFLHPPPFQTSKMSAPFWHENYVSTPIENCKNSIFPEFVVILLRPSFLKEDQNFIGPFFFIRHPPNMCLWMVPKFWIQ